MPLHSVTVSAFVQVTVLQQEELCLRANCFSAWENLVFNVSSGEAESIRLLQTTFLYPHVCTRCFGVLLLHYCRIKSKLWCEDREITVTDILEAWVDVSAFLGPQSSRDNVSEWDRTSAEKMLSDNSELLVFTFKYEDFWTFHHSVMITGTKIKIAFI